MSSGEQAKLSIKRRRMAVPRLLIIDKPSPGRPLLFVKMNFSIIRRINEISMMVLLAEQNVKQTLAVAHHDYELPQGRAVAASDAVALREHADERAAYFGKN